MKERKLNYRFYDPNTVEVTSNILLKVFIEANSEKVEKAIQDAAEQFPEDKECDVGHSA